jgi:hypothetical protein
MTVLGFVLTALLQITMASLGAVIGTTVFIRFKFGEWWWRR